MRPVHRFIGASIAAMPGSTIEQLLAMRRRIAPFNAARGLRTALLYGGGWFVQWHEGPESAVEETWRISRSHAGHRQPRVIHRSDGPSTLAERVQIAALSSTAAIPDFARTVSAIESGDDDAEPAQLWRRFAAPPAGRFAATLGHEPHRAIAVLSEASESVELIKALGERCSVPVIYQRFAGPDPRSPDSGAAYVDAGCSTRRTRVQALARHSLPLGVARLAFSRIDAVVLLLGPRENSRETLLGACAPLIEATRPHPSLHVVAAGARHLEAVMGVIPHGRA